jgi:SAM-dependent methyltransferase
MLRSVWEKLSNSSWTGGRTAVANPFEVPWVGPAYATARPNVHAAFIESARREMGIPQRLPRALDIGCGTGLSARALRIASESVVAIDPSASMLRHADSSCGVSYVLASAEAIPALGSAFDIASIACAFHWCDCARLFAEVSRVLRPGGWFLIYDSDLRGWPDGSRAPGEHITDEYWSRLPPCPRNPYFDPAQDVSPSFALHTSTLVTETVPLSLPELSAFIRTQASTIMAIASGEPAHRLRELLDTCLSCLFAEATTREFLFGGPLHVLRRC